jgi:hypothetical protein
MEIDWLGNLSAIASALIWLLMWISMWNIIELSVTLYIDDHHNSVRSKYIIYIVMFLLAALFALIFTNSLQSEQL